MSARWPKPSLETARCGKPLPCPLHPVEAETRRVGVTSPASSFPKRRVIFGKATETKGDEISPAASSRDLRITGYIAVDTATTEAAANDALIAFVESRGWTFFGSLGEYIVTSATPQATQGAERPEPPLASWPDSVRAILETIYPRSGPEDHDKAVAALVALTQAPPEAAERGESR